MNQRVAYLALVFGLAGAVSFGCTDDDTVTPGHGGAAGAAGKAGSAGTGGSSGKGGSANEAGSAGETSPAGSAGTEQGAAAGAGGEAGSAAGAGGEAGAAPKYSAEQIDRGHSIVGSLALCGGCHTASGGGALGGNPQFRVPAPNLTNDVTGIGEWTDEQVINAIRNGVDDEGRHLDPIMPYWLFHNMTDADALSVVAYLRSVPPVSAEVGAANPEVAAVPALDPSLLPNSSLVSTDTDFAAAQHGKYLVSGIAQCVRCHSPAGPPPTAGFFAGNPPATTPAMKYAPNITPDTTTGIGGWSADDVKTALKVGTDKAGVTLCGMMPSGAKGYGNMTDADAYAIGVYLTTIPGVTKAGPTQPACPTPNP